MAILNILSASESLYHKRLRRYIHFKGRKKGRGHLRQFCTGFTTYHSFQIIPWGQITLNQLRYPQSAYNFEPGPRLLPPMFILLEYCLFTVYSLQKIELFDGNKYLSAHAHE